MKDSAIKNNRISLGVKIACILACVALFSVGFAAWLILQPTVAEEKLGSFQVYAAQENNVSITVTEGTQDAKINFGAPASYVPGAVDWLYFDDYVASGEDATVEDLVATFTVEYSSSINLDEAVARLYISFSVPETVKDMFKDGFFVAAPKLEYNTTSSNANAEGWVEAPYDADEGMATIAIDAPKATSATVYVRVTFGWGELTGGKNPITYFNTRGANGDSAYVKTPGTDETAVEYYSNSQAAKLMLNAIDDLDGLSYTINIDAD